MIRNLNRPISPFRYWCQQALPLTFDDSLSYMELLSKVFAHLNACVADVATAEQDIVNLHNAYVQLQSYVNDYFDNLNVQTEIDHKIDEMVENGTFTQLLDPVVASQIAGVVADQIGAVVAAQIGDTVAGQIDAVVASQIDDVVEEQIPDAVSSWMNANLTPTTPVVDKTLSILGAAADAEVTGDWLRGISNKFSNALEGIYTYPLVMNTSIALTSMTIRPKLLENTPYPDDTIDILETGYYMLVARCKFGSNFNGASGSTARIRWSTSDTPSGGSIPIPDYEKTVTFDDVGHNEFTIGCYYDVENAGAGYDKYPVIEIVNAGSGLSPVVYDFTIYDIAVVHPQPSGMTLSKNWLDENTPYTDKSLEHGMPVLNADMINDGICNQLHRINLTLRDMFN